MSDVTERQDENEMDNAEMPELEPPSDYLEEAEAALRNPEPGPPKGFSHVRAFRSFSIGVQELRRRQAEADALRLSPEDLREVVDLFHLLNEWYEEKLR